MGTGFLRDDNTLDESKVFYKIKVRKAWFRGKDVFTERLHYYENLLITQPKVMLPLNAGNMIYTMMQRLEAGVDWEKQSSLMRAYRTLVYRLSYTLVTWEQSDPLYLQMEGQKSDVMWTISFISQVFFEDPMMCVTIPMKTDEPVMAFAIQNGEYVGKNSVISAEKNALPDIWSEPDMDIVDTEQNLKYDPNVEPESGELFAIPDGRVAQYIRMDERFYIANTSGNKASRALKHNISASLIKDFEDIIQSQTKVAFDVYQLRYVAFMNKVHDLENKLGGLEPTVYDVLPVAERGLPVASADTIARTNAMDRNSLKYIYDSLKSDTLDKSEKKQVGSNIIRSVLSRQNGYEMEYRMYVATGTVESVASDVLQKYMSGLYEDFAKIDVLRMFKFPRNLYQNLCNIPASGSSVMTEWERQRIRLFGKGYLDFLNMKISVSRKRSQASVWIEAKRLLNERYFKAG